MMVVPEVGDMEIEDLSVSDTGGAQGGGRQSEEPRVYFKLGGWADLG